MRAAEILVALLLNEALPKVIAVAWGPELPKEGAYAGAGNEAALYRKFKEFLPKGNLGMRRGYTPDNMMEVWLLRGYAILLKREDGSIHYYGQPGQADERIVYIYGLKSGTPVTHYTLNPAGGLNKTTANAHHVLGVQ